MIQGQRFTEFEVNDLWNLRSMIRSTTRSTIMSMKMIRGHRFTEFEVNDQVNENVNETIQFSNPGLELDFW